MPDSSPPVPLKMNHKNKKLKKLNELSRLSKLSNPNEPNHHGLIVIRSLAALARTYGEYIASTRAGSTENTPGVSQRS